MKSLPLRKKGNSRKLDEDGRKLLEDFQGEASFSSRLQQQG
jgi:hypothetical protein